MAVATAITVGSAIVGAATAGYGLYQSQQGYGEAEEAARAQAAIGQEQAALSSRYAGLEADINVRASEASYAASAASHGINRSILGFEQGIEAQRRLTMEVTGRRDQLEILRAQQRARSAALTGATAAGSSRGSGLQGGYGQISGQAGTNLLGVQQNLQIGRSIFDLNAQITGKRTEMSDLELSYAKQQADLATEKTRLVADYAQKNAGLQSRMAAAGGDLASAQGKIGFGSSLMSAGGSIFSAGQSLAKIAPSFTPSLGAPQSLNPQLYGGSLGSSSGSSTYNLARPVSPSSSWGMA